MNDKTLIKNYNRGWYDCAHQKAKIIPTEEILAKAYLLGCDNYIIGDDVKSVDLLSNDEILKLIYTK